MDEILVRAAGFIDSMPSFLEAVFVLGGGWVAAVVIRFVLSRLLAVARFDRLGERTGLSDFLRKGGVEYRPSSLAGVIAYWATILAAFLWAARILDLDIYLALAGKLAQALPNLAAGILVSVVGYLAVTFLSNFVLTIALNASVQGARLIAKAIKWLGLVIVFTMALEQLGLGRGIVEFVFEALIAALALGAALAFGLGCKDMAQGALKRFMQSLREKERGERGSDLEG